MDSQFLGLFTSDWGMPERMRARCCGYRNFWRAHCGFSDRRITCKRETGKGEREREGEGGRGRKRMAGCKKQRESVVAVIRQRRPLAWREGQGGHSNMTTATAALRGEGSYPKRDVRTDMLRRGRILNIRHI